MKKSEAPKDIEYYLSLPYTKILRRDEDGDIVARMEELPGCIAHGSSEVEALANLEAMKRLWIEDCIEGGGPVPEPDSKEALPSGKWVQRVPRSLHLKLIRAAREDNVSLNQLATSLLSEGVGLRIIEKSTERTMTARQQYLKPEGHRWELFGHYHWDNMAEHRDLDEASQRRRSRIIQSADFGALAPDFCLKADNDIESQHRHAPHR